MNTREAYEQWKCADTTKSEKLFSKDTENVNWHMLAHGFHAGRHSVDDLIRRMMDALIRSKTFVEDAEALHGKHFPTGIMVRESIAEAKAFI